MKKFYLHTPELPGWEAVLSEMVTKATKSGLVDAVDEVRLCVNGDLTNMMPALVRYMKMSPKFTIVQVNNDAKKWEWPTINYIHQCSLDSDNEIDYIGYAHLKAVSRTNECTVQWRHYLTYWTIERWQKNFEFLDQGYETASVNWVEEPWPHYSGNFWWATNQYLKKLKPLSDTSRYTDPYISDVCGKQLKPDEYRMECEAWIGTGPKETRRAELHSSPGKLNTLFHYVTNYPANLYRND